MANSKIETAGTGIAIAMPLIAGGITAYKHGQGSTQLVVSTALTVGSVYELATMLVVDHGAVVAV